MAEMTYDELKSEADAVGDEVYEIKELAEKLREMAQEIESKLESAVDRLAPLADAEEPDYHTQDDEYSRIDNLLKGAALLIAEVDRLVAAGEKTRRRSANIEPRGSGPI